MMTGQFFFERKYPVGPWIRVRIIFFNQGCRFIAVNIATTNKNFPLKQKKNITLYKKCKIDKDKIHYLTAIKDLSTLLSSFLWKHFVTKTLTWHVQAGFQLSDKNIMTTWLCNINNFKYARNHFYDTMRVYRWVLNHIYCRKWGVGLGWVQSIIDVSSIE